jgi:hypothetical protein
MRAHSLLLVVLVGSSLLACKTLSDVSIGYADAITTSALPSEGPWSRVSVEFPTLTDMDPLSSPSLSRYEVEPEEIESVKVTGVDLQGPAGECGTPLSAVEIQLVAAELGSTTLATANSEDGCLRWTLAGETELGPWFRQPAISIVALVDGEPSGDPQSLSLRVSFLVDIKAKRID